MPKIREWTHGTVQRFTRDGPDGPEQYEVVINIDAVAIGRQLLMRSRYGQSHKGKARAMHGAIEGTITNLGPQH